MAYRLGLDVGTASIGLAAYQLDANKSPAAVAYHAVRIFKEPLEPPKKGGVGEPKKAARRLARQARRQHWRRSLRLRRIARLAPLLGLDPTSLPNNPSDDILEIRAKAAHERVDLSDLLRVFLHMAKRRGYAGGFRVRGEGKDKGVVETGVSQLREAMKKEDKETLGDYLLHRHRQGETTLLKRAGLYAQRDLVEDELAQIWQTQERHHPQLRGTDNKGHLLRVRVHDEIFFQRPLRSPAPMVGHCPLEPSLPRAPMAQPAAQAFRIEKQLADLRWAPGRQGTSLTPPQREAVRALLTTKEKVTFEEIYKAMEKAGCPKPSSRWLNLSRGGRDELTGDKTTAVLRRLKLLDEWLALDEIDQLRVINLLADVASPEVFDQPGWETRMERTDGERRQVPAPVVEFVNRMVATGKFGRLSAMKLDSGRSAYSVKALRTLTALMRDQGIEERHAAEMAYPGAHEPPATNLTELPPHEATGNVVVDVALRQLRREINKAIRELGEPPREVIVELSRDMRLGLTKRGEIAARNNRNRNERRDAATEIEAHDHTASPSNILRYRLWTEQDQAWCPYCTDPINLEAALDGNQTEVEHIFPSSLTHIGKQRSALVLAHKKCNQDKNDRTPWDAWGNGRNPERWRAVEERAERFRHNPRLRGKARQLLAKDFEQEVLNDAAIADFSERQFHEGAWIAKLAAQWLRQVCPKVSVSRGLLTAHLRRIWGLETVIPQVRLEEGLPIFDLDEQEISEPDFTQYKDYWEGHPASERTERKIDKRIDHRHHLIDALVVGLTTRGLYQGMARHYKQVTETGDGKMRLSVAPPLRDVRNRALALIRDCNLTHKPDPYPAGPMFKENALAVVPDDGGGHSFAQRKELTSLAGRNDKTDTVRNRLRNIVSDRTREAVTRAFEERINRNMSAVEALAEPIYAPGYKTRIRRVLIRGDKADGAVTVTHHNRRSRTQGTPLYKNLAPEGYAWLEIDLSAPKEEQFRLVPLHEAARQNGSRRNSEVLRFYKGDTVRHPLDGRMYVIRQIKNDRGTPTLVTTLITETGNADKMTNPRTRKVGGSQILRLEGIRHV